MDQRKKQVRGCMRSHPKLLTKPCPKAGFSFKFYALSGLTFVGSVAEPDKATIAAENLALQRLSAGPFHALPAALLRRVKYLRLEN